MSYNDLGRPSIRRRRIIVKATAHAETAGHQVTCTFIVLRLAHSESLCVAPHHNSSQIACLGTVCNAVLFYYHPFDHRKSVSMDIFFKPTGQNRLLHLHDVVCASPHTTAWALIRACRILLSARALREDSFQFVDMLTAFRIQEYLFQPELKHFSDDFKFTLKERRIVCAASRQQYTLDDIEGEFYKYGKITGMIALSLVFRTSDEIRGQWKMISGKARKFLVCNVTQLFRRQFGGSERGATEYSDTEFGDATLEVEPDEIKIGGSLGQWIREFENLPSTSFPFWTKAFADDLI